MDRRPVSPYKQGVLKELPIGRALRRFRRLNAIKQSHAAEVFNVSQATISRWESGAHEPEMEQRQRITAMIAAHPGTAADGALKRLIETSSLPVHMVCDATHRLLAASPARIASWGKNADAFLGKSLWRFASREIVLAEASLEALGWYEQPFKQLCFQTGENESDIIKVLPSVMLWETVPLADGRIGRITTTIGGA
jgi:transcriptional regulator with XRE-family HTH domain